MFKTLTFVFRRPDISPQDFSRYWSKDHGAIVQTNPHLLRHLHYYVQHHVTEVKGAPAMFVAADGIVELAFLSREAARQFFREPDYLQRLRPDEINFIDAGRTYTVIVEDRLVVGDYQGVQAPQVTVIQS